MKHFFLRSVPAVAVMLFALQSLGQNKGVAVNNDGRAPDPTAILDVSSNYTPLATAIQKGMMIPRLSYAQRTGAVLGAPATLPQGLTVYQTDSVTNNPAGFYVVEYSTWFRIDGGADGWSINGNNLTTAANEFFGTRDGADVVFKTNGNQVMRVEGTPATPYVHVGNQFTLTAPNEQLDVTGGAIRVYNPPPGTWSATNTAIKYAATNTQGTIHFRPIGAAVSLTGDSLQSSFTPTGFPAQQNRDIVMWNGHWGNVDGTAPTNLTLNDAHSGGWRRMENEYEEYFTKNFTQQAEATCGAGTAELTYGSVLSSGALGAAELLMNPYKYDVAQRRYRCQYLFLQSELDVESNQLNGNTTATGGLCAGSAINQIGFYVNQVIAANNPQRTLQITVTVKHVPLGVNNLTFGFDNSVDPSAGCMTSAALVGQPTAGAAGWRTFAISPFTWDGQRNVLVDIAVSSAAGGGGVAAGGIDIRYSNTGANLTYSAYVAPLYPATPQCTPGTPTGSVCGPLQTATALGDCGTFGPSPNRPVIQFGGQVATTPTGALVGQNAYIWYRGGLVAESTTSPNPWSKQITPYYAFRGPGYVSAQNGVYDNQVKLNDHVFDRAFDGAVKPSDASEFGAARTFSINEMADHTRQNRHLPTMKGRDSWKAEKGFSLGDLTNQLWTTAETQALYVTELNDRLNVLELLSNDRPLAPGESELARNSIRTLNSYTDAEKAVLLQSLEQRTVTTNQR